VQQSGSVCNLAARLCAEAKDGQILDSSRIAGAVEAVVKLEDLGNLELKGLRRPVATFNVVRSTSAADARPNLTVVGGAGAQVSQFPSRPLRSLKATSGNPSEAAGLEQFVAGILCAPGRPMAARGTSGVGPWVLIRLPPALSQYLQWTTGYAARGCAARGCAAQPGSPDYRL